MIMRLFRNRRYRIYFELVDAFRGARFPLCFLLSQKERTIITAFLESQSPRKRGSVHLKALCPPHKGRIKETAADDHSLLVMLKAFLKSSLGDLTHPPQGPTPRWKQWFRASRVECPLCRELLSEEKALCRALILFLDDTDFWKGLQRAPLLCVVHLGKCLTIQDRSKGFERLLEDQSGKLTNLLDDLVRFEFTGTNEECKFTALDWLADFAGPSVKVSSGKNDILTAPLSEAHIPEFCGGLDEERLLFENEKLRRKVRDLLDRLNNVETRAASLHYRVAKLSEDNRRLEMGYTGANTQARGLEILVRDLRGEIAQLKNGGAERTTKAAS